MAFRIRQRLFQVLVRVGFVREGAVQEARELAVVPVGEDGLVRRGAVR